MRRVLAAAVILVAVPTLVLVSYTTSRSRDEPELGTLLDSVVAAGAPGVFVVVREDGKVRSEARGFADRSRSIRMRADERFASAASRRPSSRPSCSGSPRTAG